MITLPNPVDMTALLRPDRTRRSLDYVLPGLLPGAVGMIVAPGGTGKSFFQIGLALSVCLGTQTTPFLPPSWDMRNTVRGRAVILAAEEDQYALEERLTSFIEILRVEAKKGRISQEELEKIPDLLVSRPLKGIAPDILRANGHGGFDVDPDWREGLQKEAAGSRILFLDPLRRFHSCDENDSAAMTRLVQMLEEVAHVSRCSIVIVHHTSKASMWQGRGAEQQSARGSSALTDAVRWQVNLQTMTADEAKILGVEEAERRLHLHAELSKINYGPPLPAAWFYRTSHGVLVPEFLQGRKTDEKISRRRSL